MRVAAKERNGWHGLGALAVLLGMSAAASGAPAISVDTNELHVICVQGTVSTQAVIVANTGDAALDWTLVTHFESERFAPILRTHVLDEGVYVSSTAYDATRDVLWLAYAYANEIRCVRASDGQMLPSIRLGAPDLRPPAIEMQGPNLWLADTNAFRCFDPDSSNQLECIPYAEGFERAEAMALGDGMLFAACGGGDTNIYRLDPATAEVLDTFPTPDSFYAGGNHMAYADGTVWWSPNSRDAARNVLKSMDAGTGRLLAEIHIDAWPELELDRYTLIRDISFAGTTGMCWVLVRHDSGRLPRRDRLHLLDLTNTWRVGVSPRHGLVAAGGETRIDLTFDAHGAETGTYTVTLQLDSNDPARARAKKTVVFAVRAPGPNRRPIADAGPCREGSVRGIAAPFVLDGSRSHDPDGDELLYSWSRDGTPVGSNRTVLAELGGGTHTFGLRVDDGRGGIDTAAVTIVVHTNVPLSDWPQYGGPARNYVSPETNWLERWPPLDAWRINAGHGYGGPVVSEGRVYLHRQPGGCDRPPMVRCYDLFDGALLWETPDVTCGGGTLDHEHIYGWCHAWPAVDEGRVYTYNASGTACCWDKVTGTHIWSCWTQPYGNREQNIGRGASPLIEGDLAIFQQLALNKHTGEVVWKGRPVIHNCSWGLDWNGRRWVCQDGYMLDWLTGKTGIHLGAPNASYGQIGPVLYGTDKIYDVTGVSMIGEEFDLWQDNIGAYAVQYCLPVVMGDHAFIVVQPSYRTDTGRLTCVRLTDGSKAWDGPTVGGCILADGKLVIDKGTVAVAAASPTGYTREGRAEHTIPGLSAHGYGTPPVLVNKRLLVNCGDWMVCLDTASSPENTDVDGDGIPDVWEAEHLTRPTACDPQADPDNDGASNLDEYIAGTDPAYGDSRLWLCISNVNASVVVSAKMIEPQGPGYEYRTRYYSMQHCPSLFGEPWLGIDGYTNRPGNDSILRYTNNNPGPAGFYRLRARLE